MGEPLRVLIAEDSEDDARLLLRQLRLSGYEPIYERVDTPEAMRAALEIPTWDVILCDYVMPRLSVSEALELCRQRGLTVPFIVTSGVFGEYLAARAIAAGAHDYIVKSDLARLVPAIERAREQVQLRRAARQPAGGRLAAPRAKRETVSR